MTKSPPKLQPYRAPFVGEPFMYGIMGPDGKAHFEEFCVSGDRAELQAEVVDHLNRDNPEDGCYSVVALFRDAAPQASTEARPSLDAVDLARAGMALHAPGAPEHTVCAELVRLADVLKQPQADKGGARCTCPSGDGSLRHPCPMHPGADKDGGQQRAVNPSGPTCPRCTLPLRQECNCDEGYAARAALSAPQAEQGERDAG